jgi:thiol-disulfide isomerase/thioredoxin
MASSLLKIGRILFLVISCFLLIECSHQDEKDIFGKTISLDRNNQKWLVINYWAKWCEPCLKEFSVFNEFSKKYADKIIVVGINYDKLPVDEQRKIAINYAIQYPLLAQDLGQTYHLTPPTVLPTTYLISPKGDKIKTLIGPQTQESLKKALGFS